jgi:hypothetical protein
MSWSQNENDRKPRNNYKCQQFGAEHIFIICVGTIICILKAYFTFARR